jgi:hypothetical protein
MLFGENGMNFDDADKEVENASLKLEMTQSEWQQYARQLSSRLDSKSDLDKYPLLQEQIMALFKPRETVEERAALLFQCKSAAERETARRRRRERLKVILMEQNLLSFARTFSTNDEIRDAVIFFT